MIFEAIVHCRADVLPPRARAPKKGIVDETITVRLREISGDEAPVVLRPLDWRGERYVVRFHEGLLWRVPEFEIEEGHTVDVSTEAEIRRIALRSGIDAQALAATRGVRTIHENARTLSSQGDLVARICQQDIAGRRIVVEGVVHERTRSPLIRFEDVLKAFVRTPVPLDPPAVPASEAASFVPEWFPGTVRGSPFRDFLSALEPLDAEWAKIVLDRLDVEIVRPDLLAACMEREAANTNPDILMDALRVAADHDLTSGFKPRTSDYGWRHDTVRRRIADATYEAAAGSGRTLAEAVEASASVYARIPTGDRRVDDVVSPPPEDAPRTSASFSFHLADRKRGFDPGWTEAGAGPLRVETRHVVLDPAEQTEVAIANGVRFVCDDSGRFHADPTWDDLATTPAPGDSRYVHAADLAHVALHMCEQGRRHEPYERTDLLGLSLRHHDGVRPLGSDRDKTRTLDEFVENRISTMDRRMLFRCPEPVVAVQPDDGTKKKNVRPYVSWSFATATTPGETPPFKFRLDRADEAVAFARGWTTPDLSRMDLRVVAPEMLRFEDGLWNLRAAIRRILPQLDMRVSMMDEETLGSTSRLEKHLELWCADASLLSSDEDVEEFLRDAATFLSAIDDPVFEDIGEERLRAVARSSLERAMGERRIAEAEPSDDLLGFSM